MADITQSSQKSKNEILKHPLLLTVLGAVIIGSFSMYGSEIKDSINSFFSSTLALTGVGLAVFSVVSDIALYLILKR